MARLVCLPRRSHVRALRFIAEAHQWGPVTPARPYPPARRPGSIHARRGRRRVRGSRRRGRGRRLGRSTGQEHRQPLRRDRDGVVDLRQRVRHTGLGHVRGEGGIEGGGDADEHERAEARSVILRL
eukprot:scaffold43596_cov82-Phaeocystis_antarctica.AAC.3